MDGVLEELLRLENAKHQALIQLDSEVYQDAVHEQTRLLDDPRLPAAARQNPAQLLAFSKLAGRNTNLYENLLSTAPWFPSASRSYTGQGYLSDSPPPGGFSAEG